MFYVQQLYLKVCAIYGNVKKIYRNRQDSADNVMHLACWMAKATHTYTQNMQYLSFSTASVVSLMRLNVTFIRALPLLLH
jgi:hypothetical protein